MLNFQRVLFIGAHPDDIELCCGGVIAQRLSRGLQTFAAVATCPTPRRQELGLAFAKLGLDQNCYRIGNQLDTCVGHDFPALVRWVERCIDVTKPDLVVTHYPHDTHQDHATLAKAVQAGARKVGSLWYWQPTYPSGRCDVPFHPHVVVQVEEQYMQKKREALSQHISQMQKYGEENWVYSTKSAAEADSWRYGGTHGFAEVFQVSRMIVQGV